MGKLVDAEITLKYSNGQLTIASTPNTIKGDGLLTYLDLAECAIIGANYKNLNEAMDIAAEHASAIIAATMQTAGDEKTSPKMGAIVHAAQVSPFYLQCVIQKPDAPASKGKFFAKEGNLYVGVDNSDGNAWTEEFSDRQQLSFGLLAHLATTPTGRPSTSDILSIAPQHGGQIKTRHRSRQTPTRRAKAGRKDFPHGKHD